LDGHRAEAVEVAAIDPRKMGMRVAEPGHQRAAVPLHDSGDAVRCADVTDGHDAVAFDQDVAGVRVRSRRIENLDVAEEDPRGWGRHDLLLVEWCGSKRVGITER